MRPAVPPAPSSMPNSQWPAPSTSQQQPVPVVQRTLVEAKQAEALRLIRLEHKQSHSDREAGLRTPPGTFNSGSSREPGPAGAVVALGALVPAGGDSSAAAPASPASSSSASSLAFMGVVVVQLIIYVGCRCCWRTICSSCCPVAATAAL